MLPYPERCFHFKAAGWAAGFGRRAENKPCFKEVSLQVHLYILVYLPRPFIKADVQMLKCGHTQRQRHTTSPSHDGGGPAALSQHGHQIRGRAALLRRAVLMSCEWPARSSIDIILYSHLHIKGWPQPMPGYHPTRALGPHCHWQIKDPKQKRWCLVFPRIWLD